MSFWNFRTEGVYDAAADMPGKPAGAGETAAQEEPADGVLDIDGEIVAEAGWFTGDGAVIARDFRKSLGQYRNVTVRINSPGGDVMAGAEIYSALKEHSLNGHGTVRVEITALAASAASVIAMAGDVIAMYPTSYMMIHNPWTFAAGDAKELRKAARTLDVISEGLINAYQQRTGKGRDELKRMLENETWMSAGTCIAEGFADEMIGADETGRAAAACLMSGRSHGAEEILKRYAAQKAEETEEPDEPEKPDEEAGEEEEHPENRAENAEPEEEPGADPDREEEEKPNEPDEEPETEETEPDGEAENPEEEEEPGESEDPEEPGDPEKPEEDRKRDILRRAAVIAGWADTVVSMTRGGEA